MAIPFLKILILCGVILLDWADGHGRLIDPPQRSSMWRYGFKTPPNYNDNELNCGGFRNQYDVQGGRCGVCGDPYQGPRENEAGGRYANGIIVRKYDMGQTIDVTAELTANHLGWFEFKLCPNNDVTQRVTQHCLDQHLLEIVGHGTRYMVKDKRGSNFHLQLILPYGLICSQCVLQWKYYAGNNDGYSPGIGQCKGCGPQETFLNCADISVGASNSGFDLSLMTTGLTFPDLTPPITVPPVKVPTQAPTIPFIPNLDFSDPLSSLSLMEVVDEIDAELMRSKLEVPEIDEMTGDNTIAGFPAEMLEEFMDADVTEDFWDDVEVFLERSSDAVKASVVTSAVDLFPANAEGITKFHDLIKLVLWFQGIPPPSSKNSQTTISRHDSKLDIFKVINKIKTSDSLENFFSKDDDSMEMANLKEDSNSETENSQESTEPKTSLIKPDDDETNDTDSSESSERTDDSSSRGFRGVSGNYNATSESESKESTVDKATVSGDDDSNGDDKESKEMKTEDSVSKEDSKSIAVAGGDLEAARLGISSDLELKSSRDETRSEDAKGATNSEESNSDKMSKLTDDSDTNSTEDSSDENRDEGSSDASGASDDGIRTDSESRGGSLDSSESNPDTESNSTSLSDDSKTEDATNSIDSDDTDDKESALTSSVEDNVSNNETSTDEADASSEDADIKSVSSSASNDTESLSDSQELSLSGVNNSPTVADVVEEVLEKPAEILEEVAIETPDVADVIEVIEKPVEVLEENIEIKDVVKAAMYHQVISASKQPSTTAISTPTPNHVIDQAAQSVSRQASTTTNVDTATQQEAVKKSVISEKSGKSLSSRSERLAEQLRQQLTRVFLENPITKDGVCKNPAIKPVCQSLGVWQSYPMVNAWCSELCPHGYCPNYICDCQCPTVCRALSELKFTSSTLDEWCRSNCGKGTCPKYICTCS